jgi:type II secretory pathway pseudopilin PulG
MFNFVNRKGVALFMVLAMLLVVVILANVILNIVLNQARLTKHQASRIQAKYAAMAGVNYAIEALRIGLPSGWPIPVAGSPNQYDMCSGCIVNESYLPSSIARVEITVAASADCNPPPPTGVPVCISARAIYTYTP